MSEMMNWTMTRTLPMPRRTVSKMMKRTLPTAGETMSKTMTRTL